MRPPLLWTALIPISLLVLSASLAVRVQGSGFSPNAERRTPNAQHPTPNTQHPTPTPDFNQDVRPVLARHCFKCHGPDDGQRQAGLRLDLREAATALRPSGRRAIAPGKPEQSELVRRISMADGGVMPPPAVNNPLTAAEKATLRQWI